MAFGNQARIDIMAQDKTGRAIASARRNLTGLGKTARTVIAGMGGIGAGLAVGVLVRDIARVNMEFEKASREVNTLLGLSGEGFRELQNDIRGVSSALGTDLIDNTKAAYKAISKGVKRQDLTKFLEVANKAAIGGISDTETAVSTLLGVLNAYRGSSLDAAQAADILFTAVKDGDTTFGEMAESMYIAAPIAASAGVEFKDLAASIATITATTGKTNIALTQIKSAITSLLNPSKEMEDVFTRLGVSSGSALLEARGFGGAMADVRRVTEENNISQIKALRTIEGYNAMLNTTGANLQTFNRNLDNQTKGAGANEAAFEEMNQTMARGFDRVRASWQALATSMENTDNVTNATNAVSRWLNRWSAELADGETEIEWHLKNYERLASEQESLFSRLFSGVPGRLSAARDQWMELGESPKSYEEAIVLLRAKLMVLNPILADTSDALEDSADSGDAAAGSLDGISKAAAAAKTDISDLLSTLDKMLDIAPPDAPSTDSLLNTLDDVGRARKKFDELQRENQIAKNPDAEVGILKKEVAALESQLAALVKGSLPWEEKRVELQEKKNDLTREQIRLQERQQTDLEKFLRTGAEGTEAEKKKTRSGRHLMGDYSSPDYASPWATPAASPLPSALPVVMPPTSFAPPAAIAAAATTTPAMDQSAATQTAVDSIQNDTTKTAGFFEKVATAFTQLVSRLEIAEQQIANAR